MTQKQRENVERWKRYLAARSGTYDYRCRRYAAVYEAMYHHPSGLADGDLIVDVGAGACEFGRYLYRDRVWCGQYVPVDGSIDGGSLEEWAPPFEADWFVAIEVIEHLYSAQRLIEDLVRAVRKGVVVTTPHTDFLGLDAVIQMDPTHVNPIRKADLLLWGADDVRNIRCFGERGDRTCPDTLLAIWKGRAT